MVGTPTGGIATVPLLLAFAGTCCGAEAGVIATYIDAHPIATNAVAMSTACVLLLILSVIVGEPRTFPSQADTWLSFGYLVIAGSCGFFVLALFVLNRWTASASAYGAVLWPPVAAVLGALLLREPLTLSIALGGAIVLAGVYFGALRTPARTAIPLDPPP
jgi:drug/metabolite transporter (DMT)-like permease